jgi:hypothetical protein
MWIRDRPRQFGNSRVDLTTIGLDEVERFRRRVDRR